MSHDGSMVKTRRSFAPVRAEGLFACADALSSFFAVSVFGGAVFAFVFLLPAVYPISGMPDLVLSAAALALVACGIWQKPIGKQPQFL